MIRLYLYFLFIKKLQDTSKKKSIAMKTLKFIITAAILALAFLSCEKDSSLKEEIIDNDFYYVKYQISGKVYFYIDEVKYNTEKGGKVEKFSAAKSFERTCGPVKKNFNAQIELTERRGTPSSNAITISISKNNGPFTVKASGEYSASYIIDF